MSNEELTERLLRLEAQVTAHERILIDLIQMIRAPDRISVDDAFRTALVAADAHRYDPAPGERRAERIIAVIRRIFDESNQL